MTDRTGREVKKHQTVDFFYTGTLQGRVVDVQNLPTQHGTQVAPPQIVIQVVLQKVSMDGELDVYIIEDAAVKDEPKVVIQ